MKEKAVFLDRDGTINVEKHYLHKIEDFEFLPGAIKGLQLLQDTGYLLIVVTNQSGIGRGYYTEEAFHTLNAWMLQTLEENGIHITKVYYCPHLPDATVESYRKECNCRKPALGMYQQAIEEFDINVSKSWAIGDKIRDCAVCETMGARGFLIGENEKPEIIQKVKTNKYQNVCYAADLLESAKKIAAWREI